MESTQVNTLLSYPRQDWQAGAWFMRPDSFWDFGAL